MEAVAAFTDTYLPTVNGVSYTIRTWRERWLDRGGRMDVVYPRAEGHDPDPGEHPVPSLPFPFYDGYRLGVPSVPHGVRDVGVVHVHTPFSLGVAGAWLARRRDLPLVASYHTPTAEYTDYLAPTRRIAAGMRRASEAYERTFLGRADRVLAPSETTATYLREDVGVDAPVRVIPNGVDTDRFRPVEAGTFRRRHGLGDRPLVGYTGRHGYEKRLDELVDAAAEIDATVVFGGDGPAREDLKRRAADSGGDVRFLGFLDREELPAFYSALSVFAFPSPVETQGLVALEAMACGTPVVAADSGALTETVEDGVTGYHYESGDVPGLVDAIERALAERECLGDTCLDRREETSVARAVEELERCYRGL